MGFTDSFVHVFRMLSNFMAPIMAERRAVTAIEYALIASLIAVAIIAALTTLGGSISGVFNSVASQL